MAASYSTLLLFLVIQWRLIATQGQTLGKKLLSIKIVDGSGDPPGLFRGVIVRLGFPGLLSVLAVFVLSDIPAMLVTALSLGNIALICLEPPRCLHDYVAGTYVIDA
jgi:uncharacterized RDD family membrane protein YckC